MAKTKKRRRRKEYRKKTISPARFLFRALLLLLAMAAGAAAGVSFAALFLAAAAVSVLWLLLKGMRLLLRKWFILPSRRPEYIMKKYHVDEMDGILFERFCGKLLKRNGFSKIIVTPGSGDQGVDLLAEKGGIRYAVQCKRYDYPVGNRAVQEAAAGKVYYGCDVAAVMTNNFFTESARELAEAAGVLLWDRNVLLDISR